MMAWGEIIKYLGSSAILMAALAWLVSTITKHFLDKTVDTFKLELQKQALEHQVTYKRVDDKLAEALLKIHGSLLCLMQAVQSYVSPIDHSGEPDKRGKLALAMEKSVLFETCLREHSLYIPPSLFKRSTAIASKLAEVCNEFTIGLKKDENPHYDGLGDHWTKGIRAVVQDIGPLFNDMTIDFQRRLGVTDPVEQTK